MAGEYNNIKFLKDTKNIRRTQLAKLEIIKKFPEKVNHQLVEVII